MNGCFLSPKPLMWLHRCSQSVMRDAAAALRTTEENKTLPTSAVRTPQVNVFVRARARASTLLRLPAWD